jgi:hypothetical protein
MTARSAFLSCKVGACSRGSRLPAEKSGRWQRGEAGGQHGEPAPEALISPALASGAPVARAPFGKLRACLLDQVLLPDRFEDRERFSRPPHRLRPLAELIEGERRCCS